MKDGDRFTPLTTHGSSATVRLTADISLVYGRYTGGEVGERADDGSSVAPWRRGGVAAHGRASERLGSLPGRAGVPLDPGSDRDPQAGPGIGHRGGEASAGPGAWTYAHPRRCSGWRTRTSSPSFPT